MPFTYRPFAASDLRSAAAMYFCFPDSTAGVRLTLEVICFSVSVLTSSACRKPRLMSSGFLSVLGLCLETLQFCCAPDGKESYPTFV